jgi:hypothetical protein
MNSRKVAYDRRHGSFYLGLLFLLLLLISITKHIDEIAIKQL